MKSLNAMTLLVDDYDKAKQWFIECLEFVTLCDVPTPDGHRFVRIAPSPDAHFSLVLSPASEEDKSALGRQGGSGVVLFLYTDDFDTEHQKMLDKGVNFLESPRVEEYGKVAVFEDLYGNRWDLLEPYND